MLTTLSIAVLLTASVHLAPPPAAIGPVAPPLAQRSTSAEKEEAKEGILKTALLLGITLVLVIGGGYAIHKLRAYLKEADIIK